MPVKISRDKEFDERLEGNLAKRYEGNTRENDRPHVSDIIPTSCLRQAYYRRKFPHLNPLTKESVHHFIRGESSEHIVVNLAGLGVTQKPIIYENVIARPDILSDKGDEIVELKDTVGGERYDVDNDVYRSYLRQLLYYLTMSGIEKGVISIRYNVKELQWKYRDKKGNDWFMRPANPKGVGTESWRVFLGREDFVRFSLQDEIKTRGNLFTTALETNNVSILPRVPEKKYNFKCKGCPFRDKCYSQDGETQEARNMRESIDLLDIPGNLEVEKIE